MLFDHLDMESELCLVGRQWKTKRKDPILSHTSQLLWFMKLGSPQHLNWYVHHSIFQKMLLIVAYNRYLFGLVMEALDFYNVIYYIGLTWTDLNVMIQYIHVCLYSIYIVQLSPEYPGDL